MSANNEQRKMEILNEIHDELEIVDIYKTPNDVDKRYYDLISALKVKHGELIFSLKLDGFELKKIWFDPKETRAAIFDFENINNKEYEKGEIRTFKLIHGCDLFIPVDTNAYEEFEHDISVAVEEMSDKEYDNNEARRIALAVQQGDMQLLADEYGKYKHELLS